MSAAMTSARVPGPLLTWEQYAEIVTPLIEGAIRHRDAEAPELVSLDSPEALGRVIAREMHARHAVPAFDNSQMDGYALRSADIRDASPQRPITLTVGITTAAGDPRQQHVPGTASPIMTGAVIPIGADTVVPIEECVPNAFPVLRRATARVQPAHATATIDVVHSRDTPDAGAAASADVMFLTPSEPGRFVRAAGQDRTRGSLVGAPGDRLTAARIGALIATGHTAAPVRRRLRVLVCATGDELLPPAAERGPGTAIGSGIGLIPDINTPMLAAALREAGAEVRALRTSDDVALFRERLTHEAASIDLIVTTGGISAGAFEVVRLALQHEAVTFHSVALQPGGPQGSGTINADCRTIPIICLPGNSVSVLLSAELFFLPALREASGHPAGRNQAVRELAIGADSPADKHQVRRGVIEPDGRVRALEPGSHLICDLADADVLLHLPVGVSHAAAGASVLTWRIND